MKGIITLNIEVDYGVMLDSDNQGAIHLFTGAKTVEDMIKIHMDHIGTQLADVVKDKPLVTYTIEGVLRQEEPESPEPSKEEVVEELIDSLELTLEKPVETKEPSINYVESLDRAIENVSLDMGIPQVIKATKEVIAQLESQSGTQYKDGKVHMYHGFEVEEEGMEEPFTIVYKAYGGSEIKYFSPYTF